MINAKFKMQNGKDATQTSANPNAKRKQAP